jgi:hypothetical protein
MFNDLLSIHVQNGCHLSKQKTYTHVQIIHGKSISHEVMGEFFDGCLTCKLNDYQNLKEEKERLATLLEDKKNELKDKHKELEVVKNKLNAETKMNSDC